MALVAILSVVVGAAVVGTAYLLFTRRAGSPPSYLATARAYQELPPRESHF